MRWIGLCAGLAASPALAAEDAWSFEFGQGVAEYAVGSFEEGKSSLALSCAEGGLRPGSVSVSLRREGFATATATPATFTTDAGSVTLNLDARGSVDYASVAVAPRFRTLWRLLATGTRLEVRYGPGAALRFPLTGAGKLLGAKVCPKQLAG